jgi:hypothetical protein
MAKSASFEFLAQGTNVGGWIIFARFSVWRWFVFLWDDGAPLFLSFFLLLFYPQLQEMSSMNIDSENTIDEGLYSRQL